MEFATAEIAKYGLLGVLLIIVGWVAWQLKGDLHTALNDRITDWKNLAEIIQLNSTTMQAQAQASEARTRAAEAMAKANELQALAATNLTAEIVRLKDGISTLEREVKTLREEAIRRIARRDPRQGDGDA